MGAALAALAVLLSGCSGASDPPGSAAKTGATSGQQSTAPAGPPSATGRSGASGITDVTGATSTSVKSRVSLAALRRTAPRATISVRTLPYGGEQRAYLVAVPDSARAGRHTLPLIVVLHGAHASVDLEAERTGFLPYVEQGRAVAIYPVGYHQSWNVDDGNCCHDAGKRGLDDAGFIAAATADARSWLPTDPARTYLVGFSNGARLAFDVLCAHSTDFTAVATMAAVPEQACPAGNRPSAISALLAVGSSDQELTDGPGGADPVQQLDAAAVAWGRRDGCTGAATSSSPGITTVTDYGSCSAGTAVRTVAYDGLTHQWPGAVRISGEADVDPDVRLAALAFAFFGRHRR